jgi:hypothetical protein
MAFILYKKNERKFVNFYSEKYYLVVYTICTADLLRGCLRNISCRTSLFQPQVRAACVSACVSVCERKKRA